jgi:hypothetical protein
VNQGRRPCRGFPLQDRVGATRQCRRTWSCIGSRRSRHGLALDPREGARNGAKAETAHEKSLNYLSAHAQVSQVNFLAIQYSYLIDLQKNTAPPF